MNILHKIQGQPEYIKKIIVWAILIVIGVVFAVLWLGNSAKKIAGFPKGQLAPISENVQKEFGKLKEIKMPGINLSTEDQNLLNNTENLENTTPIE